MFIAVHRSAVRQLKDRSAPWLEVEWLPAYAPDLNPVEAMWNCMKHGDLANFLPNDLYELGDAVVDSLFRQRNDRRIKNPIFTPPASTSDTAHLMRSGQ